MSDFYKINIVNASATDGMHWSRELIETGLKRDDDFYWEYVPRIYDWISGDGSPSSVNFYFRDEYLTTYYKLKWQKSNST